MHDSFLLAERYQYSLVNDIDPMYWSDFRAFVEGAETMYARERKAAEDAAKARR